MGLMEYNAFASVRRRLASHSLNAGFPVRLRDQVAGNTFMKRWANASEPTPVSSLSEQCLVRCLDMLGFSADEVTCLINAAERAPET